MARSLSQEFQRKVAAALSPQERQKRLAEVASQRLAEASAANARVLGRPPAYRTTVDGREGAPLTSVNPDRGRIVFQFEIVGDVLRWINQQLVTHSPVLTGRYAKSHAWYADGQPFEIDHVPPAREYSVLSLVPYARKIERGESRQAPDGVYEVVAVLANQRFGNIGHIGFGYRSPTLDPAGRRRREDRSERQPCIVITL